VSDEVLDAMPQKPGGPVAKEAGSGSSADDKSAKPSSASQRRASVPKPLPKSATPYPSASDTKSVPFDRKVTAPAMEATNPPLPAPAAKPGSNLFLVLAVMVPVMAAFAGGTWWYLRRSDANELKPVEQPKVVKADEPKKVEPELLTVTLKSTPSGASVLEEGVLVGTTPLERKWPKETTHSLTFQLAGYQDLQRSFRLDKNESFEVELPPSKKVSGTPSDKGKTKPKPGDGIEAFE
jgi:serine/threonine-protein kinase